MHAAAAAVRALTLISLLYCSDSDGSHSLQGRGREGGGGRVNKGRQSLAGACMPLMHAVINVPITSATNTNTKHKHQHVTDRTFWLTSLPRRALLFTMQYGTSHLTHASHIAQCASHITHHTSHITHHTSHITSLLLTCGTGRAATRRARWGQRHGR